MALDFGLGAVGSLGSEVKAHWFRGLGFSV